MSSAEHRGNKNILDFELETIENLKSKSVRAFKWSFLGEIVSRSAQPIVTTVLARILAPADFGIVAVATIIVSFCQLFQDFGLGKTIIQTEKQPQEYANNAFWLNLVASSVLYTLIFAAAPLLAVLFKSPESTSVLRLLSLQLVLLALSTVHTALLQRSVRFNIVFIVRLVSAIIPGLVSIPLAVAGHGVNAIVFGTLSGSVVQLLLYWWFSDWRPKLEFDRPLAKKMLQFSKWIAAEGVASWFITSGDSLLLGAYLGVSELGQYRIGSLFVIFLSNLFFTPFVPVAYSFFSRVQTNTKEFKNYYLKLSKIVAIIVLPIGVSVAMFASPITEIVLGDHWKGTEIVIAIMSIRWALGCLVGLNATAFTSFGRPDINVKILSAIALISIPSYFIAAPYGLVMICVARLLIAQIDNTVSFLVSRKIFDLNVVYPWENIKIVLAPLAVMVGTIFVLTKSLVIDNLLILVFAMSFGLLSYMLSLYVFQKELARWSFKYALAIVR